MRRALIAAVALTLWMAAPGAGQLVVETGGDQEVHMDNLNALETKRPILEYMLGGAFLIGSLALGFMSSKRSHLD